MSELGSSDKISVLKRVVDETTFQTNILALGMAVEGAGGSENRSTLGKHSLRAAWDTAALIEESILNGPRAVKARALGLEEREGAEPRTFAAEVQNLSGVLKDLRRLLDESGPAGGAPLQGRVGPPSPNPGTHLETSVAPTGTGPAVPAPDFQLQQPQRLL